MLDIERIHRRKSVVNESRNTLIQQCLTEATNLLELKDETKLGIRRFRVGLPKDEFGYRGIVAKQGESVNEILARIEDEYAATSRLILGTYMKMGNKKDIKDGMVIKDTRNLTVYFKK